MPLLTLPEAQPEAQDSGVDRLGESRGKQWACRGASRKLDALVRTRALVLGRSWLGVLSRPTRVLGSRHVLARLRVSGSRLRLRRPLSSRLLVEVRGKVEEAAPCNLIGRGAAELDGILEGVQGPL